MDFGSTHLTLARLDFVTAEVLFGFGIGHVLADARVVFAQAQFAVAVHFIFGCVIRAMI